MVVDAELHRRATHMLAKNFLDKLAGIVRYKIHHAHKHDRRAQPSALQPQVVARHADNPGNANSAVHCGDHSDKLLNTRNQDNFYHNIPKNSLLQNPANALISKSPIHF